MKSFRLAALLPPLATCLLVSGDLQGSIARDPEELARLRAEMERRMLLGLESLWYGTPEARLETAEQAVILFRPACYLRGDTAGTTGDEFFASLARYLGAETDEWIRTRLLDTLAWTGWCPPLNDLFRDALSGPSTNGRRAALRWFSGNRDDASATQLDDLRRHGVPEWMRADLLRALALHERAGDLRDLVRLSDDANLDVALAAVEAIADSDDPRALDALATRAGRGPALVRLEAVLALEDWEEEPRALEALIEASRPGPWSIRLAALSGLAEFEAPAAVERLIETLRNDPDPQARIASAGALAEAIEHPDTLPALLDVVRRPRVPDTEGVRQAAICALMEIDEAAVLPDLIALPHDPMDAEDSLTRLIAWLGRREGFDSGCSAPTVYGPTTEGETDDPRTLCVLPPEGMQTVRCWLRPGVAGRPDKYPRLPARWSARPEDHYDRDGELWVELDGPAESECWVPRRLLEPCAPAPGFQIPEARRAALLEFDLPTPLLETDPLRFLVESEVLRIIDPGDEVSGVAQAFEPGRPLAEALAELRYDADHPAPDADAIARMETLLRRFRDEPLLGPAPPAAGEHDAGEQCFAGGD